MYRGENLKKMSTPPSSFPYFRPPNAFERNNHPSQPGLLRLSGLSGDRGVSGGLGGGQIAGGFPMEKQRRRKESSSKGC